MSKCPECGGNLQQMISARIITFSGRGITEKKPGGRCQNYMHCDYIAISENEPDIPHPSLSALRMTLAENKSFRQYSNALAPMIPETERDQGRCGGRPVFTQSRLPVEIIVALIVDGESDTEIIENYPRMTKFILTVTRALVKAFPQKLVDENES